MQCFLQAAAHGARQLGVGQAHLAVELGLLAQQLVVELLAAAFQSVHHGLQVFDHLGQGLRLLLQGLVGFLALMHPREGAQ